MLFPALKKWLILRHNHLKKQPMLDKIAKENGVSIIGTGINPGLIMDLLVVVMTGCHGRSRAHCF